MYIHVYIYRERERYLDISMCVLRVSGHLCDNTVYSPGHNMDRY